MPHITENNFGHTRTRRRFSRKKNFELYKHVIDLRKREFSYTEIRHETGLAKSTINNWLTYAGLTLSREHLYIRKQNRIRNHIIATAASKITRAKRKENEIQLFLQEVKKYFSDPFFVAGILLYEAEGTKGESNGFSNSDYRLVAVYINFLERYFSLNRNKDMGFRLYIHDSRRGDLLRIFNFWSKKLTIKSENIRLSWKHNVVTHRRTNLDYVGQFEVRVRGYSIFRSKILAVSDIILHNYRR